MTSQKETLRTLNKRLEMLRRKLENKELSIEYYKKQLEQDRKAHFELLQLSQEIEQELNNLKNMCFKL